MFCIAIRQALPDMTSLLGGVPHRGYKAGGNGAELQAGASMSRHLESIAEGQGPAAPHTCCKWQSLQMHTDCWVLVYSFLLFHAEFVHAHAARTGNFEICRLLVEAGAPRDAKDKVCTPTTSKF